MDTLASRNDYICTIRERNFFIWAPSMGRKERARLGITNFTDEELEKLTSISDEETLKLTLSQNFYF